ncbi:hypothetical protein CERSUDRAFT_161025 [Gelatoporia subvermispora B]|uniref:rRNA-processing protein EFG1 n=1 Tax=Ceriporiopsis subvermispora (strain B) TaxID=914234 RepID=M2QLG2_CERS8|nr:hypothetical protein CERSUDRAFT_161025 [Gelatoporia subvermispora B]
MAPTRAHEQEANAGPSSSTKSWNLNRKSVRHKQQKHPYVRPDQNAQEDQALPGVQKLKAALRQTRRLLAKDKLAADVRVETERRAKALEADLARAEQAKKERAMSVRYHAIKFFERQKVTRKLKQTKRQLSGTRDSAERKAIEEKLFALRVDLNYIIHYPKTKKYISLFPPEVRNPEQSTKKDKQKEKAKDKGEADTDVQREELRAWVRQCMARGEMSAEPENEQPEGRSKSVAGGDATPGKARASQGKAAGAAAKGGKGLGDDAFFESGSADEDGDSGDDGVGRSDKEDSDENVDMEE